MKTALAAIAGTLLSVAAFMGADKIEAKLEPPPEPIFHCVHGISYVEFNSGVVVERDVNGNVVTCRSS